MRDFLDSILTFLSLASLSDEEWTATGFTSSTSEVYDIDVFNALKAVLESRELVSTQLEKLKGYFIAKGVDVSDSAYTAKSKIFLGAEI